MCPRDKLMSQYGIENIQLLHLAAVFLGNDFSSDQVHIINKPGVVFLILKKILSG